MKTLILFATILTAVLAQTKSAKAQNNPPVPAVGNVALPLDEYNQLVARAGQPPKPSDAPPVPFVLKSAEMNLQVNGESVSGTILIAGEVFAQGNRKVPLLRNMVIRQARQEARDLPVAQERGVLTAMLGGPAAFAVTLDASLPLAIEPGRASFSLAAPQAGVVRVTLSLPGNQTLVNLSPGLITGRSSRDGRTTIEAALVPGETATIWWAARLSSPQAPAPPKEVRFLSDVKTLISVGDAELGVVALAEITVVQGEPRQFTIRAPDGFELTGATGATLASSEVQKESVQLNVSDPALRSHQFLISLVRTNMAPTAEIPLITFEETQRETGEVLIEGDGAMELTATERGVLRRMDLKETSPYLRSLARGTLHTAFRYQKKPAETPAVALDWMRFPNSKMISAVAQQTVVTTLVTSEGRSLTEMKLTLKNQAQPFLKVELPPGASILTAEVAGEKVKPVLGPDGSRVPLLRPGFHPADSYTVSFVMLHAGAPFEKKGGAELALPKIDIPIARIEWEVFLPQRYKVADFGGDAVPARLLPLSNSNEENTPLLLSLNSGPSRLGPGDVGGIVVDPTGLSIPGAQVVIEHVGNGLSRVAVTDAAGRWGAAGVPSGLLRVTASKPGFQTYVRTVNHDGRSTTEFPMALKVGSVSEQVTVEASSAIGQLKSSNLPLNSASSSQIERAARKDAAGAESEASTNVTDLQRRVVGVLPISVSVPRTGSSYRFVRALAVDEETRVTFRYHLK